MVKVEQRGDRMEDSRARKLRAIERWRSRRRQKDEKSNDFDDRSGSGGRFKETERRENA
jgi:hypothetical protein